MPALPPTPDAFFNVTAGLDPFLAPGVRIEQRDDGLTIVLLNVAALGEVSDLRLILRLLNTDGEGSGEIQVVSIEFDESSDGNGLVRAVGSNSWIVPQDEAAELRWIDSGTARYGAKPGVAWLSVATGRPGRGRSRDHFRPKEPWLCRIHPPRRGS